MNIPEITDNTTFDYIPVEINYDNPTNFLYNPNTSNLHKRSQQIIYGSGVDDYVYNEIKKAKYQGCFYPAVQEIKIYSMMLKIQLFFQNQI